MDCVVQILQSIYVKATIQLQSICYGAIAFLAWLKFPLWLWHVVYPQLLLYFLRKLVINSVLNCYLRPEHWRILRNLLYSITAVELIGSGRHFYLIAAFLCCMLLRMYERRQRVGDLQDKDGRQRLLFSFR